jgi:hypothetical protein
MMSGGLNYLYVEGKSDFHVIKNLLKKRDFSSEKMPEANRRMPGTIYVGGFGDKDNYTGRGIEALKVAFKNTLSTDYHLSTIGIVVDANSDPQSRWTAIRDIAQGAGECDFPVTPTQSDYITTINRSTKPSVKIGVWIMPDNEHEGMLEHFVSDLIPSDNFLWQKAQTDVAAIPEAKQLFDSIHTRKAEIHTWLAWQETPGRPMGIGITAGWFDHKSELASRFVEWIRKLFELE